MKKLIVCGMALATFVAFADKVELKSGSFLTGKAGVIQDGVLKFDSDDLGAVDIKVANIKKLVSDRTHIVQYKDNSREEVPLTIVDGAYVVNNKPIDIANVKATDPSEETWHGSINGAFTAQRGNSYENTGSLVVNLNRRWEKDRLNFDFGYHFSEAGTKSGADKKKTEDRWDAMVQHDHFWSTAFYSYENLHFERDEIQELDSRYRVGLGLGYQWLDGAELAGKWSFNQEAGANWVREEYANESNSHEGGFAAIRYAHHLTYLPSLGNSLEFFHNLEFLPNAEDFEKYLAQADVGFTTKLIYDFDLLAKVEWDFNSKPARDRRKSDLRYIVGLGYKW